MKTLWRKFTAEINAASRGKLALLILLWIIAGLCAASMENTFDWCFEHL